MNTFPGHFLIKFPKVDFITILDTHGAIPWSDSMNFRVSYGEISWKIIHRIQVKWSDSVNKFPGSFFIESEKNVRYCAAVGIVAGDSFVVP